MVAFRGILTLLCFSFFCFRCVYTCFDKAICNASRRNASRGRPLKGGSLLHVSQWKIARCGSQVDSYRGIPADSGQRCRPQSCPEPGDQIQPRPAAAKRMTLLLKDYDPKSMLHGPSHEVPRAKFPVIDVSQPRQRPRRSARSGDSPRPR